MTSGNFKSLKNILILLNDKFFRTAISYCIVVILVAVKTQFGYAQVSGPHSLYLSMISATGKVQTLRYQLLIRERIKDVYQSNSYLVKVQTRPFKVYTFSMTVNIGAEALYVEGANNNEAIVNPNRFPWFNLNLSPKSLLIRKDHIFTLDQSGFAYINKVFTHYYHTDSANFVNNLKLMSDTIFNGHLCSRIVLNSPDFKWISYTVKKGETFTTIADKFYLNDYMLLERNGKNSFTDLHEGEKIIIPTVFTKKMILAIDKTTFMPLQQILYDDKGLFAVIEFKNLILNPPIPPEEFTTGYKDYGF